MLSPPVERLVRHFLNSAAVLAAFLESYGCPVGASAEITVADITGHPAAVPVATAAPLGQESQP